MNFRIESRFDLKSDWLPPEVFTRHYTDQSQAVAVAIEGVDDPVEQDVHVVCVETGEVVWRSTDEEYE